MLNIEERVHFLLLGEKYKLCKKMIACLSGKYDVEIKRQVIDGATGLSGAELFQQKYGSLI